MGKNIMEVEILDVQELLNDLELGDFGHEFENYSGSTYICDAITEIADNYVSIYYSDIMDFIKNNVEEVEEAIDEFGWDGWLGPFMAIDLENKLAFVYFQQMTDTGFSYVSRRCKNIIYSSLLN